MDKVMAEFMRQKEWERPSLAVPIKDRIAIQTESRTDECEHRSNRNYAKEIKYYIDAIQGTFTTREIYDELSIRDVQGKAAVRQVLKRLADDEVIERKKDQPGTYRKVESELKPMDLQNADTSCIDLWLPLGIHNMVSFQPGNIILVGGDANVGKTAFLLNCAKQNVDNFNVHYFSSEMGAQEFKMRINLFNGFPLENENFKAYERFEDFADVIQPGKGNLNIIDYLELVENFYMIAKHLKDIHNKLKGAIAIVAVQKRHPSDDDPLGGKRGLEKPRLVLSIKNGTIKILKAKLWKNPKQNPNFLQCDFKLANGWYFSRQSDWQREDTI